MQKYDTIEDLILLWEDAPAHLQTYISENYPEMWEALNNVSKR